MININRDPLKVPVLEIGVTRMTATQPPPDADGERVTAEAIPDEPQPAKQEQDDSDDDFIIDPNNPKPRKKQYYFFFKAEEKRMLRQRFWSYNLARIRGEEQEMVDMIYKRFRQRFPSARARCLREPPHGKPLREVSYYPLSAKLLTHHVQRIEQWLDNETIPSSD